MKALFRAFKSVALSPPTPKTKPRVQHAPAAWPADVYEPAGNALRPAETWALAPPDAKTEEPPAQISDYLNSLEILVREDLREQNAIIHNTFAALMNRLGCTTQASGYPLCVPTTPPRCMRATSLPQRPLIADALIDRIYACFAQQANALVKNKKIVICCGSVDDGAGDFSFIMRLVEVIQNAFADLSVTVLTSHKERLVSLAENSTQKVTVCSYDHQTQSKPYDLLIFGPALPQCPSQKKAVMREIGQAHAYFFMPEYDRGLFLNDLWKSPKTTYLLTGADENAAGFLFDRTLPEAGRQTRRQPNMTSTKRAHALKALSQALNGALLNGRAPRRYDEQTRLCFVYPRRPEFIGQFISHVAQQFETTTDIDIVVITGRRNARIDLSALCAQHVPETARTRWNFEFINNNPRPSRTLRKKQKQAVTIRIIAVEHLPRAAFLHGLMSCDLAGVTGDQSLSEVVSIGRPLLYDAYHYKYNFVDNLCGRAYDLLGDEHSLEVAKTLHIAERLYESANTAKVRVVHTDPVGSQTIHYYRKAPAKINYDQVQQFWDFLRKHADAEPRIAARVLRHLIRNPEMQHIENEIEALLSCDFDTVDLAHLEQRLRELKAHIAGLIS